MRAYAAKEKIGGGVLTLAGLLAATMIDRLIPDHPNLLVWFTAVAAILLMIAGGLALAVWPRGPVARPPCNGRASDRSAGAARRPDTLPRATFHLLSRARISGPFVAMIAMGLVVLVALGVAAALFLSADTGRTLMTPPESGDLRVHAT